MAGAMEKNKTSQEAWDFLWSRVIVLNKKILEAIPWRRHLEVSKTSARYTWETKQMINIAEEVEKVREQ